MRYEVNFPDLKMCKKNMHNPMYNVDSYLSNQLENQTRNFKDFPRRDGKTSNIVKNIYVYIFLHK